MVDFNWKLLNFNRKKILIIIQSYSDYNRTPILTLKSELSLNCHPIWFVYFFKSATIWFGSLNRLSLVCVCEIWRKATTVINTCTRTFDSSSHFYLFSVCLLVYLSILSICLFVSYYLFCKFVYLSFLIFFCWSIF